MGFTCSCLFVSLSDDGGVFTTSFSRMCVCVSTTAAREQVLAAGRRARRRRYLGRRRRSALFATEARKGRGELARAVERLGHIPRRRERRQAGELGSAALPPAIGESRTEASRRRRTTPAFRWERPARGGPVSRRRDPARKASKR